MFNLFKQEKVRGFEVISDSPSEIRLPTRRTTGSACYDFYTPCNVVVKAHSYSELIKTNVKAYMPDNEVLLLFIRSSAGIKKHLILANCTGVIDTDYYNNLGNEGNIGFMVYNNSDEDQVIYKGECIVQGMFTSYGIVDDDYVTESRHGGYGSTGK